MAATVTSQILISFTSALTSALDLVTASAPLSYKHTLSLTNGTGANQANKVWSDQRTLAASATEDLDLAGGITDALGATITLTKIKAIAIHASSANTNSVLVGGATANQLANWVGNVNDVVVVKPGGTFVLTAPDANGIGVTADTGDLLKIANSAGSTSVTYDIIVIGVG